MLEINRQSIGFYFVSTLLLAILGNQSSAEPLGGQVSMGSAAIDQSQTNITDVFQNTDRAVIDWESFNLSQDELLRFNQPSANSIIVNRDLSGAISSIQGELQANGQVFILNPAGVLFGQNALVDVAGLVVSDLDLAGSNFWDGDLTLEDTDYSSGGVKNYGIIRSSGGIALIGQQVINDGQITTQTGDAQLLSASEVSVFINDSGINFELTAPVMSLLSGSDYLVENTANGVVASMDGGDVVYSTQYVAGLVPDRSVNQFGADSVLGVTNQAGDIFVVDSAVESLVATSVDDVISGDNTQGVENNVEDLSVVVVSAESGDAYFAKFRKTNIDELMPDCGKESERENENENCSREKAVKEYLGKLLVDGAL